MQRTGHDGDVQCLANDIIKELDTLSPSPRAFQRNLKSVMKFMNPASIFYSTEAIVIMGTDSAHSPRNFVRWAMVKCL